jgi:Arabinofuranosyltransferase A C terminal
VADEVPLPMPYFEFDLKGWILLFGLVTLSVTASRRALSRHLLGLVGAAYLLYFIGYLGFLADTPLDTLRAHGVIEFPLAVGAGLGAIELARLLFTGRLRELVEPATAHNVVVVGAVVLIFAVGQHVVRDIPYLEEQREAEYPRALLETFARGTNGEYADAVVLTDLADLSTFLPTYTFNSVDAHYSHPAALFNDRADLLTLLSGESDTEAFALALTHNRYDRIDYVALRAGGDDLLYEYLSDAFPLGVGQERLRFSRDSFASPTFTKTTDSRMVMYRVNAGQDPLRSLRSCPRDPQASKCRVLGTVLTRYASHLDDETRDLAMRWRAARR